MTNLLRADMRRLSKSLVFYIAAGFMLLLGAAMPIIQYLTFLDYPQALSFDLHFTFYAVAGIVVLAAFTALFLGSDYSDGTMRNKLIAGHGRYAVYASGLIVSTLAALILCAAYLLPYLLVGSRLLGEYSGGRDAMITLIIVSLAAAVSFASVFTLINMLSTSKARSAVLCLVCSLLLLYAGILVTGKLAEPEFYSTYSLDPDGNVVEQFDDPNPNYVSGTARRVLTVINDLNPGGQAVRVFTQEDGLDAGGLAVYDLIVFILASGVGMILFRKKDLK